VNQLLVNFTRLLILSGHMPAVLRNFSHYIHVDKGQTHLNQKSSHELHLSHGS